MKQFAKCTFYQMKFQARSGKRVVKVSKCGETYIDFYKLYEEYDPFLTSGGAESNSAWVTEVIIFSSARSSRSSRSGNLRPSVLYIHSFRSETPSRLLGFSPSLCTDIKHNPLKHRDKIQSLHLSSSGLSQVILRSLLGLSYILGLSQVSLALFRHTFGA